MTILVHVYTHTIYTCTWVLVNMVKKHCEITEQSSLISLTDSSKVTQKLAAVSYRGWG